MNIIIRQETPADLQAVYDLIKKAFLSAEHTDGHEQDLAVKLRAGGNFIPKLSLVAFENNSPIGHVLFTKLPHKGLLIAAPLSVLPQYQGKGIGAKMMAEAHSIAAALGYKAVHLVGHPSYYPRFGYKMGSVFGIEPPAGIPPEVFMFLELFPEALNGFKGGLIYPEEFGIK